MTQFSITQPTYDPIAVQPMRDELVAVGFKELLNSEDVDSVLGSETDETTLVLVNSVCGCAAGGARPGATFALQNNVIPDHLTTVFAGQEKMAVEHVRQSYLGEYPPSSPAIALMKGRQVLFVMERQDIVGRSPEEISTILREVFDKYCSRQGPSIRSEDYAKVVHAVACGSKIPLFNQS